MNVIRAAQAGFCMGVALALRKLDKAVEDGGGRGEGRVATLGPIIHNPQVLKDYEDRGVIRLDDPAEARPGMAVVIRAHGISREDEAALKASGAAILDATCPRVKKARLAIAQATAGGRGLLLYGEADHPEVRGLLSYARGPHYVFDKAEDLRAFLPLLEKEWGGGASVPVLAAQTTQDRPVFDALRKELYNYKKDTLTVLDTICDATRQRQEETLRLAEEVDVVVVVGGRQSGNTRRLADIAGSLGVRTILVETEKELDPAFFAGGGHVGLTAGASTPKSIIDAVERRLRAV